MTEKWVMPTSPSGKGREHTSGEGHVQVDGRAALTGLSLANFPEGQVELRVIIHKLFVM